MGFFICIDIVGRNSRILFSLQNRSFEENIEPLTEETEEKQSETALLIPLDGSSDTLAHTEKSFRNLITSNEI